MNNDNTKIGVVIPAYLQTDAHIEYLHKSIESVRNQTYSGEIEITVVINGRGIGSILDLPKIDGNVIRFESKLSAAVARNIGAVQLSQRSCDYLCFLDADDMWLSNKIERQLHYMKINDLDFCFTQAFCIDSSGNRTGIYPQPRDAFSNSDIKKQLLDVNMLINSTVMVKTSCFFEAGMYPPTNEFCISGSQHLNNKGNICEDYLLWFNSINRGFNFGKIDERLVEYRLHTSVER